MSAPPVKRPLSWEQQLRECDRQLRECDRQLRECEQQLREWKQQLRESERLGRQARLARRIVLALLLGAGAVAWVRVTQAEPADVERWLLERSPEEIRRMEAAQRERMRQIEGMVYCQGRVCVSLGECRMRRLSWCGGAP